MRFIQMGITRWLSNRIPVSYPMDLPSRGLHPLISPSWTTLARGATQQNLSRELGVDVATRTHGSVDTATENTTVLNVLPTIRHPSYIHGVLGNLPPPPPSSCGHKPRSTRARARITCVRERVSNRFLHLPWSRVSQYPAFLIGTQAKVRNTILVT